MLIKGGIDGDQTSFRRPAVGIASQTEANVSISVVAHFSSDIQWLFIDDHFHRIILTDHLAQFGIATDPIVDLFSFFTNETVRTLITDWGTMPWWSHEELRANFFRPLTALTHMLDYCLWPDQVWLYHLHSIAWSIVACFAVRRL